MDHSNNTNKNDSNEDSKNTEMVKKVPSSPTYDIIVLMKAMTWERESHGLYDYESRRISKFE